MATASAWPSVTTSVRRRREMLTGVNFLGHGSVFFGLGSENRFSIDFNRFSIDFWGSISIDFQSIFNRFFDKKSGFFLH